MVCRDGWRIDFNAMLFQTPRWAEEDVPQTRRFRRRLIRKHPRSVHIRLPFGPRIVEPSGVDRALERDNQKRIRIADGEFRVPDQ